MVIVYGLYISIGVSQLWEALADDNWQPIYKHDHQASKGNIICSGKCSLIIGLIDSKSEATTTCTK